MKFVLVVNALLVCFIYRILTRGVLSVFKAHARDVLSVFLFQIQSTFFPRKKKIRERHWSSPEMTTQYSLQCRSAFKLGM